ncbi:MAG: helix-turn-helix transcriptional regulator [Lysobacterales bacterium]
MHPVARLRRLRRYSQLELSLRTGVSQRHLSCIETGRATPSRATLLTLLDALDAPLNERNAALLAAGLAPRYSQLALEDPRMDPARDALRSLLNAPGAAPALVIDAEWNLLMANAGVSRLLALLEIEVPAAATNLLDWLYHGPLRERLLNPEEMLADLRQRIAREAVHVPALRARLATLHSAPASSQLPGPILLTRLRAADGRELRLFSMFSTFGSPLDVTLASLRIEHLFPADAYTAAALQVAQNPVRTQPASGD